MAKQAEAPELPHFDDVRKALSFALNFRGDTKASAMSAAMAQVRPRPRKLTKRALDRYLARFDAQTREVARELIQGEQASRRASYVRQRPASLGSLDRAHLAGLVLAQLARLDPAHQVVLKGATIRPYDPCACRAPCCSGRRKNAAWAHCVVDTCDLVLRAGDVLRAPGKKGFSTAPALRLALVEQYYTREHATLAALAGIGRMSTSTADRHREWIHGYLEQCEREAWHQLALVFDQVGITGALL